MTRARRARRLVTGAMYGGGGLGLAGAGLVTLVRSEARLARRRVQANAYKADPPTGEGLYGGGRGTPLTLVVLGDSSAVGHGVEKASETPGVLLAAGLAELAERPVRLVRLAVTGAQSKALEAQVDRALEEHPDVEIGRAHV